MQEYVEYEKYSLSIIEEWKCVCTALVLSILSAWILYKSFWGLLLGGVIYPVCRKKYIKKCVENRKRILILQFRDAMQCLAIALLAGYSIENAWKEAEKEVAELYGKEADMTRELHQMNCGIRINQPVEGLMYQFAKRSNCEDIISFAEVFRFAKRNGGNLGKIIRNTVNRISEKIEVEKEIETVIIGKKTEQRIMNTVPVLLLVYLNITSEAFLAPLYGNILGVCIMTMAFCAYLGTLALAHRVVNIKI